MSSGPCAVCATPTDNVCASCLNYLVELRVCSEACDEVHRRACRGWPVAPIAALMVSAEGVEEAFARALYQHYRAPFNILILNGEQAVDEVEETRVPMLLGDWENVGVEERSRWLRLTSFIRAGLDDVLGVGVATGENREEELGDGLAQGGYGGLGGGFDEERERPNLILLVDDDDGDE